MNIIVNLLFKQKAHRLRLDCFEVKGPDGKIFRRFNYPMITGWLLEAMHLVDGGVLKDFLVRLVDLFQRAPSRRAYQQMNEKLRFWKPFNFNEQSRFSRSV
jgi:hypothetical protein